MHLLQCRKKTDANAIEVLQSLASQSGLLTVNAISQNGGSQNKMYKSIYLFFSSSHVDVVDRVHALRKVCSVLHPRVRVGHVRRASLLLLLVLVLLLLLMDFTRSLVGWRCVITRRRTQVICGTNGDALLKLNVERRCDDLKKTTTMLA